MLTVADEDEVEEPKKRGRKTSKTGKTPKVPKTKKKGRPGKQKEPDIDLTNLPGFFFYCVFAYLLIILDGERFIEYWVDSAGNTWMRGSVIWAGFPHLEKTQERILVALEVVGNSVEGWFVAFPRDDNEPVGTCSLDKPLLPLPLGHKAVVQVFL